MNSAYLILGSNIKPGENIPRALELINRSFEIEKISNTWRTRAVGTHSDDFLNTAVEIKTGLGEQMLKDRCLCHIEEIMGRIRQKDKNAPRTIDIDIVVFNEIVLDPDIFSREHLALPLSELIPNLIDVKTGLSLVAIAETLHKRGSAVKVGRITPIES